MALRRQLATLAATCLGAAMLAAAVPAVASAALGGSKNGITLTAQPGGQAQSHAFLWPLSPPSLCRGSGSRTPGRGPRSTAQSS
jgi:hypothetical protein